MIINVGQSQDGNGKKSAHGIVRVSTDKKYFSRTHSTMSEERNYVEVKNDFGFVPSFIFVMFRSLPDDYINTVYKQDGLGNDKNYEIDMNGAIGYDIKGNAYVTEQGFLLPFVYVTGTAEWYAYE